MKTVLFVILVSLGLSLSACMHSMMMGHGSNDHPQAKGSIREKELVAQNLRAHIVVPPLIKGKKAEITFMLHEHPGGMLLSDATVHFSIEELASSDSSRTEIEGISHEHSHHENQEKATPSTTNRFLSTHQPVSSGSDKVFRVSIIPQETKSLRFLFIVSAVQNVELTEPMSIEITQTCSEEHQSHGGMMSGMSRTGWIAGIAGAVVMGTMMWFMLSR